MMILPQFDAKRFFYSRLIWQFCLSKTCSYGKYSLAYFSAVTITSDVTDRTLKYAKFRFELVRGSFRDRVNLNLNLTPTLTLTKNNSKPK